MNIYNVIILDESGSMSSIYKETIQSMNEVLNGIRKDQEEHPEQHHYVTIVTFEGQGIEGIKTRRDRVPIDSIKDFTTKDYRPGGCTPLHDAMGKTLNEMEGLVREDDRVMATVITDGMENSSTEYSGKRHWWTACAAKAGCWPISVPTRTPLKWPGTCTFPMRSTTKPRPLARLSWPAAL